MVDHNYFSDAAPRPCSAPHLGAIDKYIERHSRSHPKYATELKRLGYFAHQGANRELVNYFGDLLVEKMNGGGSNGPEYDPIDLRAFQTSHGVRFADLSGKHGELCIMADKRGNPHVWGNKALSPFILGRAELENAFKRMADQKDQKYFEG